MKIDAKNITVRIDEKTIIEDISMHLNDNEFVGIIGPNGSGKSTFLKSIYRVLKPVSGEVFIDDENLLEMSYRRSAKKMAVVSQFNDLNFDLSVKQMVLMGRAPHKKFLEADTLEDYKIIEEALKQVGMLKYIDRSFLTLSGGEKQRVILARAIAQQSDVLILDEPTNHLDINHQLSFLKVIKEKQSTVFCAIHDLNTALMFCDRLYALKDGKVLFHGKTLDVVTEGNIEELYHVKSKIYTDTDGIHIRYMDIV